MKERSYHAKVQCPRFWNKIDIATVSLTIAMACQVFFGSTASNLENHNFPVGSTTKVESWHSLGTKGFPQCQLQRGLYSPSSTWPALLFHTAQSKQIEIDPHPSTSLYLSSSSRSADSCSSSFPSFYTLPPSCGAFCNCRQAQVEASRAYDQSCRQPCLSLGFPWSLAPLIFFLLTNFATNLAPFGPPILITNLANVVQESATASSCGGSFLQSHLTTL